MNETQAKIDKLLEDAQQLRDELVVKANLGVADAKDELDKLDLDDKYETFKATMKEMGDVTGDTAEELQVAAKMGIHADSKEEIYAALELAGEEIKKGYERIKKLL